MVFSIARVGIMCSAAHSECVGQLVGRTTRSAPSKRQHAGRLGKRPVVADVHPDPQPAQVVDRERPVAGVGEHVDAEERQVNLAIRPDQPPGPTRTHALNSLEPSRSSSPKTQPQPVRSARSTTFATSGPSIRTAWARPSSLLENP